MEAKRQNLDELGNTQPEENYSANEDNPGPSPEAINEPDDKPASRTIWVAVAIAVVILGIIYLVVIY